MRKTIVLLGCTMLAACGGGDGAGPTSPGGTAVTGGTATGDVAPGAGGGVTYATTPGENGTVTTGSATTFLTGSTAQTLNAVGAAQSVTADQSTEAVLYEGNASTVRNPSGTIAYDPRDGIFTLTLADSKANVATSYTYQDPGHRTDIFTGSLQNGVPLLNGFNYLQGIGSGTGDRTTTDQTTLFYQRPGDATTYVSLAGYVRNSIPVGGTSTFERGAFVFGTSTLMSQVPTSGKGTYTGGFLATMVNDRALQWIAGDSKTVVDFGNGSVSLDLTNGVVGAAFSTYNDPALPAGGQPQGAIFTAHGDATIDLVKSGGFTGTFSSASFTSGGTTTPVEFGSISTGSSTAGASSLDGTFYGPKAVNVGGGFRIVGGVPDSRVDIMGAFTGANTGK